jgi:serine-type D-Ala-D-Ala carboxypeptidase (penicillin-binding protein 5/6)
MLANLLTIFFVLISQLGLGASGQEFVNKAFSRYLPDPQPLVVQDQGEQRLDLAAEMVSSLAPLPGKVSDGTKAPLIDARSVIAIDAATKETLFAQNEKQQLPMASITKVMTCLLVIEYGNLDEIVTIKPEDVMEIGSDIDLRAGEEIKLDDLLKAGLIKSANDAALAMGRHVGGDDLENFVDMMNTKAKELGLTNTHYTNPHGFDEDEHYSSARDIALLMSYAMANETFQNIAAMKQHQARILNYDEREINIVATNKLLIKDDSLIEGGKTGFTDEAGECLVTVAKNPDQNRIIVVILNSPDRFGETQKLINYIFKEYRW